jgi:type I restriction enzyme R subunit
MNTFRKAHEVTRNTVAFFAARGEKVDYKVTPARVAQDKAYQNAQANSGKQNARLEHDKALNRVVLELLDDHTEQFSDNAHFKRWLADMVFDTTHHPGRKQPVPPQSGAQA